MELAEAFKIAVEVHGAQTDKAGEPYLFHVLRVAMAMDTDEERVVAILHDTLEDASLYSLPGLQSGITLASLLWVRISGFYGLEVESAVRLLSHAPNEPYMDYIRRLSTNPLAVKVKLQDIKDNLRQERLRKLGREEANRLYDKYMEAHTFLLEVQWKREDWEREHAKIISVESPAPAPPAK